MGGYYDPPIVCRVPTLLKKTTLTLQPQGVQRLFLRQQIAHKIANKVATRWTNSTKRGILDVSMRKESNKWQNERLILALMKMFIRNL